MAHNLDIHVILHGSPQYEETIALRFRILREPLGLAFTPEQLAAESADVHLAAYCNGTLVACLVLSPLDDCEVKMRQVAVDDGLQGQGIGTALVERSEQVATERGWLWMVLSARETAVPFYLRLGYDLVGEPYEEVTIPHRKMQKQL
jgi:predicted GNAT family N-acyltransferase